MPYNKVSSASLKIKLHLKIIFSPLCSSVFKPVLLLLFCYFVCNIVPWQDPCVLSSIIHTGPKHGMRSVN